MDRGAAEDALLIELGGRPVAFRFARRRRRTLGIVIDAAGMRVAAPLRAPWREVEAFLRDKERWIVARLDEWARAPRPRRVRCVTGESLPVLGVTLVLEVREGRPGVERRDARLVISAPPRRRPLVVLLAWLRRAALDALAPRLEHFAGRLGLPAPRLSLSNARTQWGQCSAEGAIRLSWRLVHVEPRLADYVIAHEVAHLVELNHSRRFWALVESLYPDWRDARERLELAGASLPLLKGKR
jgi:predicted metal-dependent hydrolase